MAEKIFNKVRTLLLHDTVAAWQGVEETFKPKKGEVVLMSVPATDDVQAAVLIKVGDGETVLKDLPYVSALAMDVINACKDEATLKTFINGVIADAGIASNDAMEALAGRVTTVEGVASQAAADIVTLKAAIGEGGSVEGQIDAAIEALDLANTYAAKEHEHVMADITDLAAELAKYQLAGDYATKAEAQGYADAKDEAIAAAKKAGDDAAAALGEYKTANDAVIAAIKDGEAIDSFADVEAEIAKKQDIIPANTYDAYGAAADAKSAVIGASTDGANADTIYGAKAYAKGQADAAAEAAGEALAEAQAKVASVSAADKSVAVGGTATAPTVGVAISAGEGNALSLAADGLMVTVPAAAEYSIVKAAESGDYAAVYNLTKDGAVVGASINIPKDMVVESGAVVENPTGQAAGTYIELKLQNVTEPLYINVGSLIEYVTSGSATGDMVVVAVSEDHKVTATITDGTVTKAKLEAGVQTSLGLADSALQKADITSGTANGTIAVEGTDVAVTGLGSAAYEAKSAFDAAGAAAGVQEALLGTDADTIDSNTIKGVKNEAIALDARIDALEAIDHEHANKALLDTYTQTEANLADAVAKKHAHENKAVLDGITAEKVAAWDGAQAAAEATAAGALSAAKTELEGKIADAQAAAEKVANDNNTAMDTRVKALEDIDHEAYKGYADQAELDAIAAAKTETEAQVKALAEGAVAENAAAITDIEADITTMSGEIDQLQADIALKANDADLAKVAKSGLMDDLAIGADTTIVFVAGNASSIQ